MAAANSDTKPVDGEPKEGEVLAVNIDETSLADWSEEEERQARRKLDFALLPILALAFFALQMDRANMGNALTSTITQDLGVTTNQINVGNSLLNAGVVLLEIPSNVLMQRVGPRRWLSGQIVAWGLVATLQNFVVDYPGYLVTRVLLGLCEAGFAPGALYTMSTWYKKDESSLRISLFFLGNILANGTTSLIGAAILSMGDRYGIAGWRWLFIIEGSITVTIGVIFLLFLPPAVGNGRPLISFGRWSYFTSRESHILSRRVLLDDPAKAHGDRVRISGADILETVRNPRVLLHVVITLTSAIPSISINTYAPSVIKSLGYGAVRANAMASVGCFVSVVLVVALGRLADRSGVRGPCLLLQALWALIAFACLRESVDWGSGRRYAAVVFSSAANFVVHILNVGWLSVNCRRPQERSIAMAMIVMSANCGGIAANQVFRTEDAPLYHNAFTACLVLSAVLVVEIVALSAWYFASNKKLEKEGGGLVLKGTTTNDKTEGQATEELVKRWWWTW
ncbi:MFS general substrate transporter [Camillea tinctor]|nr:MFS general substrate transporter [Camillea tinctor]